MRAARVVAPADRDEDRALAFDAGGAWVVVVADGAGGRPGGREAADAVIDAVVTRAVRLALRGDGATCAGLLAEVDRSLAGRGEATAVVAIVRAVAGIWTVQGASLGDSGAWLVHADRVDDLTRAQVRKPLVGSGRASPVAFGPTPVDDARLLVATDGLLKYAPRERLAAAARAGPIEAAARALVDGARLPSGGLQDDVAVVLLG